MFVGEFDDLVIAEIVGDEADILWNLSGGIVSMLEEGEFGPFGMFGPGAEDGGGPFEGAAAGEVEKGFRLARDAVVKEVL